MRALAASIGRTISGPTVWAGILLCSALCILPSCGSSSISDQEAAALDVAKRRLAEEGKLHVREALAIFGKETTAWGNMRGGIPQMQLRQGRVHKAGGYTPTRADVPALLEALRSRSMDIPGKYCIAGYLLDLDRPEAREFIAQEVRKVDYDSLESLGCVLREQTSTQRCTWACDQILAILTSPKLLVPPSSVNDILSIIRQGRLANLRAASRSESFEQFWSQWQFGDTCRALSEAKCAKAVPVLCRLLRMRPGRSEIVEALVSLAPGAAEPILLETLVTQPDFSLSREDIIKSNQESLERLCKEMV